MSTKGTISANGNQVILTIPTGGPPQKVVVNCVVQGAFTGELALSFSFDGATFQPYGSVDNWGRYKFNLIEGIQAFAVTGANWSSGTAEVLLMV